MIYLTFYHSRNIFKGNKFQPWIKRLFPDGVNFEGCESGNYSPTISIHLTDFEKAKKSIPTKNLIRIQGCFEILQQLASGVRDFDNKINN